MSPHPNVTVVVLMQEQITSLLNQPFPCIELGAGSDYKQFWARFSLQQGFPAWVLNTFNLAHRILRNWLFASQLEYYTHTLLTYVV